MPTNKERREVAERLRVLADENAVTATINFNHAIFRALGGEPPAPPSMPTIGYLEAYDKALLYRIADLIEPEPEIITCEFDSQSCGKIRCKRCGAFVSVDSVWDCISRIPVRYCPNCGAKVVSNAD